MLTVKVNYYKSIKYGLWMKTEFNADWQNWIKTNVDNGQDKHGIFKILLDEGFSYQAIQREMQFEPTIPVEELVNPFASAQAKQNQVATNNYGQPIAQDNLFIPNGKQFNAESVQLYTVENFLNSHECQHIIAAIESQLRPSELSSFEADNTFRTSRTCDLGTIEDSLIEEIDQRICKLLGVDESYSEAIQGQHYSVGQEFKPHTDYFEEHEINEHGAEMGQRTFTVMIYLNTVEEGGITRFTKLGHDFEPKQGLAVIWSSLNPDGSPNSNTMHHAQPVLKGYKAIITKWFRSNSRLPEQPPMFARGANDFIPNYTATGFAKAQLPSSMLQKIRTFYSKHQQSQEKEIVPGGFISNSDQANTKSSSLVDLSAELRAEIHQTLKLLMEQWCGKELLPTYVYGIRVYHRGAVLKCHQDRLETHIISSIINIDQQVDQDWPLVIDDNYYRRHKVMLKPGEIIFYEGGRLTHGRPYPLDGDSFANIFCHFKPADYIPRQLSQ